MKKPLLSILLSLCLLLCFVPFASAAESDIVILYENDAHCAVDGYSKLAAMKQELLLTNDHVSVVSCGDFVQGSSLGAISQGEYIVNIMNLVGYDALTLGNHEFDYRLDRLQELIAIMDTKPVCSNFQKLGENETVFEPFSIVSYGDTDIAFIGVTTPDTLTSSSPTQFMDENGNYTYTFHSTDLYDTVQKSIDAAQAAGADYIVALSHLGTESVNEKWSAQALVQHTSGFDAVLDGHSHSVVESMTVTDESGEEVVISSTGTQFAHIGKLTIEADGDIVTTLIPTATYDATDPAIDAYIAQINEEYAALGDRIIGKSLVDLTTLDENGNRLIRTEETNLGDFCADAFRVVTGADIGVINGGGIRADMAAGNITFNDILSVFPFNNTVCMVEVSGQQIVDLLELGVMLYPEENGSFQHVSGITFTLDGSIPSSVVLDENGVFVSVAGDYRVKDVCVLDPDTNTYEPLDPDAFYTLASHNYLLLDHGNGASMLNDSKVLLNNGMLDVELLEVFITEHLGGVIGEEYAVSQGRITIGKPAAETTTTTTVTTTTTSAALTTTTTALTTTTTTASPSPSTGESSRVALCVLIVLVSGACVLATTRRVNVQ